MSYWWTSASATRVASTSRRRLTGTVILISTYAQSERGEEIAASPAAGFIPKAELSASAVLRLAGASSD